MLELVDRMVSKTIGLSKSVRVQIPPSPPIDKYAISYEPQARVGSTPTRGTTEKKSMIWRSPRFARRPNYTGFSSQNLIFGFVSRRAEL